MNAAQKKTAMQPLRPIPEYHPCGQLSPCGVLDVGRRCPHSCTFCFYSFYDGSEDQFHYLRHAPWVKKEALNTILDHFSHWNLTHFDYTGGEPTLHPDIIEITRYAHHRLGLRGRMITMGLFLLKKIRGSQQILLDQLLDAGLHDLLLSLHTTDKPLFKKLTGGDLDLMDALMHQLDERHFSYCTNTVVCADTAATLPKLAKKIIKHNVRIANLIIMRMDWGLRNATKRAIQSKGRYDYIAPRVKEAIDILDHHNIAVNVRYAPLCIFKGYERHIVGYKGIQLDPYEWRNGTLAASEGKPFLKSKTVASYYKDWVPRFETDPVYKLTFGSPCQSCTLKNICDGVDQDYIDHFGWEEFKPYSGTRVDDIVHFRYAYKAPFRFKLRQYE
ncbi:radical SAM protein [Magnetococcales bacterium HHB-1]